MHDHIIESKYSLDFRKDLTKVLSNHLKSRHSVEIIGMKRVGISNFLRFFLHHPEIISQYISKAENHLFIPVDLNDLIESEVFPFWRLTFKRIADAVENCDCLSETIKKKIQTKFLNSIQTGDLFLTVDGIRDALNIISKENIYPTIFLLRFDRLKKSVTREFFSNLQSLPDATGKNLSFVFTTERKLHDLNPEVFDKASLSVFSHILYLEPASGSDMNTIYNSLIEQYELKLNDKLKDQIISNAGGHTQYLHLSIIILNELKEQSKLSDEEMIQKIYEDERVILQSEELYSSLTKFEQDILGQILNGKKISEEDKLHAQYLWNTGIIIKSKNKQKLFSPYLQYYLEKNISSNGHTNNDILTKKEHILYTLLLENKGEITERDKISELVWPEYTNYGVSDWSIDRLVSRLRKKLKAQKSPYSVQTIRTRGFKLVEN